VPTLDASTLLSLWEAGAGELLLGRALSLLPAAYPERSMAEWARAPIGERDSRLLDLRECLFGSRLEMLAPCPRCGEMLELNFQTGDVRARAQAPESLGHLARDGYEIEYRLPASEDLLAVANDAEHAANLLFDRCIVRARQNGAEIAAAALPDQIRQAVESEMPALDPSAECQVALECARCGHQWTVLFDIVSYLWSELEDWAQRTLRDVHALASAYGWSEREILSLSPGRRQLYVELATG
jgi:hypothetical protein